MEDIFEIPNGVDMDVNEHSITVKGKKGQISRDFDDPRFNSLIQMQKDGNKLVIKASAEKRQVKAMVRTMMAHIRNMARGVTHGYKYDMKIVTTHFPITVAQQGNILQIKNFFGEKNMRLAEIVGDTKVKIEKEGLEITGINLEEVSQTAANVELACKLRGRDRRIFQDGIYMHGKSLQTGEKL